MEENAEGDGMEVVNMEAKTKVMVVNMEAKMR